MTFFVCILSGLLAALSIMQSGFFFVAYFAISPIIYLLLKGISENEKKRSLYIKFFLFVLAYNLATYHWFWYLYPMEFMGLTKLQGFFTVLLCQIGVSIIESLIFSLIPLIFRALCPKAKPTLAVILFASLWCVFEWLQTFTWLGLPFARFALSQSYIPQAIRSASLFGSLFISFLLVLVNGFVALAAGKLIECGIGAGIKSYAFIKNSVIAISLILANLLYGTLSLAISGQGGEVLSVALIQGNIASGEKWQEDGGKRAIDIYIDLSYEAAENSSPDIILWPETVITYDITGNRYDMSQIKELAKKTGATVYVGTFTPCDTDSDKYYNSVMAFYPDGSIDDTVYNKRKLVPFGEYTPMEKLLTALFPVFEEMNLFSSYIAEGSGSNLFETEKGKIGSLICFDSIYERIVRKSVADGAELLLLSTNDSWYKDSPAVYQHNRHAVLRAVENGRCIARAANTGISSLIGADGRVSASLGAMERGYVCGELCLNSERTLYSYIGDLPVWASLTYMALLACNAVVEKIKNAPKDKGETENN